MKNCEKLYLNKEESNYRKGISLIVLAIIIVIILILSSAIVVVISTTNPIAEGKMAKFQNDRDNMQAIFTNTVSKVMTKSRSTVQVQAGQLNDVTSGVTKATGQATYTVNYPKKGIAENGTITFDKGKNVDGEYYTGSQLPIYNEGETIWHVDDDGILTLKVGDNTYGDGNVSTGDIIKNMIVTGNSQSVIIKVTVSPNDSIDEYIYYIREPGENEWKEYKSSDNEIEIDGLKEGTRYEVKVKVIKDGEEEESLTKEVVTKGTQDVETGALVIKLNNKNGQNYEEGTWSKDNIYIRAEGNNTSYSATGANTIDKTSGESLLTNEGTTIIKLTTMEGSNIVTKEITIKIDKQPPEGRAEWNVTLKKENNSDITVNLEDVTDDLSGVDTFEYYLNGNKVETTKNKKYIFENLEDGIYELKVVIIDNAGNKKEIEKVISVGIPDANDTNRVAIEKTPTGWTKSNVTLKLTYTSEDMYVPQYSQDGITWEDVSRICEKQIDRNTNVFVRFIYHGDIDIPGKSKEIIIDNIDKDAPVINSLASNNTEPTIDNITLVGKAIDTLSGISFYQFSTSSSLTENSEGWKSVINTKSEITQTERVTQNGTYYFYVKDAVGNVSKQEIVVNNIDKNPPEIISLEANNSGSTNGDIVITGKAIDSESGIVSYQFSTSRNLNASSGGWQNIQNTKEEITQTITVSENETYYFYVKDAAGNINKKEIVISGIDKNGPTNTPPQLSSNTNSITATIKQTDDNGINNDTIQFAIKKSDEDEWSEWITSPTGTYTFPNLDIETSYDVKTKVTDTVGNTTESAPSTISTTSMTKPTLSASNIWTNQDVNVRVSYPNIPDTTRQYSVDGITWENLSNDEYEVLVTVSSNNTTVFARLLDSSGQTSGNATYKVTCIDKEAPIINSFVSNIGSVVNDDITLTAKAIDTLSGIIAYQFSTDSNLTASSSGWNAVNNTNEEITVTNVVTENGTYYFYVRDLVGNVSKQEIVVQNVDKNAPTISSLTSSNTNPTNGEIDIIGKAVDTTSGIIAYQFSTEDNLTSNSSGWTTIENTKDEITQTKKITENGTYYFYVKDAAGNVSKEKIVIDNIDKILPTVSISTNGGSYKIPARSTSVSVSTKITATDDGGSGIETLQYQFSTSSTMPTDNDENWKNFVNGSTITDQIGGGTYYLYIRVLDRAGNMAVDIQKSNAFTVDYQIVYNTNGGSTAPQEQTKVHDENLILSNEIPTKDGYTFLGWSTDVNATEVEYNASGVYSKNESTILYAIWEINTYTATFDSNGGTEAIPKTITKNYNQELGTLPTTSREGYVFDGWYTEISGGTKISSSTLMPLNNVTYYAHWLAGAEVSIVENPISIAVIEGNNFTFNVLANGVGTLTYQWYYSATGDTENGTLIPGATSSSYTGIASKDMDGKAYYCIVTSTVDSSSITAVSQPALLLVQDANYSITKAGVTTYYTTLATANSDAVSNGGSTGGGTIVTLKDVVDTSAVIVNKNIVLNTNGKTITRNSPIGVNDGDFTFTINGGGTIISENNDVNNLGNSTINLEDVNMTSTTAGYPTIANSSTGTININGAIITSPENGIAVNNSNSGTINLKSGSISSTGFAIDNQKSGNISISGGTITTNSDVSVSIYNRLNGNISVTGGSINAGNLGIYNNTGNLNISNGEIHTTGTGNYAVSNEAGTLTIIDGTIVSQNFVAINNTSTIKATISGGNISSENSNVIQNSGDLDIKGGIITAKANNAVVNSGTLEISDGTITSDNITVVNSGTKTINISGGNIISNATDQAALYNHTSGTINVNGGTISSSCIGIQNTSGELNISGGNIIGKGSLSAVTNLSGTLEITSGKIKCEGDGIGVVNKSNLTSFMSGGTIEGNSGNGLVNFGTFEVKSNAIISSNVHAVQNLGENKVTISGGTIVSNATAGYATVYNNSGTMEITGGTINTNSLGVCNETGTMEITGGSITVLGSGSGIINESGTLNFNNATVKVQSSGVAVSTRNSSTSNIVGGTLQVGDVSNYGNVIINDDNANTIVTGGNILASDGSTLFINKGTGNIKINAPSLVLNTGENQIIQNMSTGTVEINSGNMSTNLSGVANNSTGKIKMTGGSISSKKATILNKESGEVTIDGGEISAEEVAIQNATGNVTINSCTVTGGTKWVDVSPTLSEGYALINNLSGNLVINDINLNSVGVSLYNSGSSAKTVVNGGSITSQDDSAFIINNGTGVIGNKSAAISTSNPIISGSEKGVKKKDVGTFEFYNGIIRGIEAAYEGTLNTTRSGATLRTGTSGSYKTAYYS